MLLLSGRAGGMRVLRVLLHGVVADLVSQLATQTRHLCPVEGVVIGADNENKLAVDITNKFATLEGTMAALRTKLDSLGKNATEEAFRIEQLNENATATHEFAERLKKTNFENEEGAKKIAKMLADVGSGISNARSKFQGDVQQEKNLTKESLTLKPLIEKELSKENKETVKAQIDVLSQMADPGSALSVEKLEARARQLVGKFENAVKPALEKQVQEKVVNPTVVGRLNKVRKVNEAVGKRASKNVGERKGSVLEDW